MESLGDSAMANGGGTSPGEPDKPRISQEDKEHLMRLRWLWETGYQIDCVDGADVPDPELRLSLPTAQRSQPHR